MLLLWCLWRLLWLLGLGSGGTMLCLGGLVCLLLLLLWLLLLRRWLPCDVCGLRWMSSLLGRLALHIRVELHLPGDLLWLLT